MTATGAPRQRTPETPAPAPHRPTSTSSAELGFTPQPPVHWLSPSMLAATAVNVVLSSVVGEFLDKRELQGSFPSRVYDERPDGSDDAEVWFDFVADLGDGFDPTYTIAYLLGQDEIEVDGARLPRGRFLMMGGDEVYPTPSSSRYTDKTKGPYKAALPVAPPEGAPHMYALPGNHDWYDGLSSFMRLFAKGGRDNVGGWRNEQDRSYFAIRLPHRWWLLAVDTQFGAYIDDPQLAYFREAVKGIAPGDRVIVCPPTPSWVEATEDPGTYDAIDFFVREIVLPTGAEIKVMLSGDLHHYARYEGPDRQLIHCGGGGAYLYPTHRMPESIPVPPPSDSPHHVPSEPTRTYQLKQTFPSKQRSRRYLGGIYRRLPSRNVGFIGLLGTLHTAFMVSLIGVFLNTSRLTRHWLELPIALTFAVLFGGCIAFAKSPTGGTRNGGRRIVLGSIHGIVQVAVGVGGTWLFSRTSLIHTRWPLPAVSCLAYLVVLGVLATLIFATYLLLASLCGVNVNESFSAQSIIDSKSFLRLHIDAAGALHVHVIGVDRVSRRWVANPGATRPHASWLEPAQPIRYRLVEPPIVVS